MRRRLTRCFASFVFAGCLLVAPAAILSVSAEEPAGAAPPSRMIPQPELKAPDAPAMPQPEMKNPSGQTSQPPDPKAPDAPAASQSEVKNSANLGKTGSAAELVSTAEELRFVELANEERRKRGLSQLVIDPLLIRVARLHSAEMRDRAYFNHNSPTVAERTPMDRYLKAVHSRPDYACVGENLFYCSIADVKRGHDAFMNSPTHRDNVLFARYEKIGVGIIKNERGEFWVTQMYLTNTDPQLFARQMAKSK